MKSICLLGRGRHHLQTRWMLCSFFGCSRWRLSYARKQSWFMADVTRMSCSRWCYMCGVFWWVGNRYRTAIWIREALWRGLFSLVGRLMWLGWVDFSFISLLCLTSGLVQLRGLYHCDCDKCVSTVLVYRFFLSLICFSLIVVLNLCSSEQSGSFGNRSDLICMAIV
jgi:hypothetical protein